MRIAASRLDLAAASRQETTWQRRERLEQWTGPRPAAPAQAPVRTGAGASDPADGGLLDQLRRMAQRLRSAAEAPAAAPTGAAQDCRCPADQDGLDPRSRQIATILEKLFGVRGITSVRIDRSQVHASVEAAASVREAATAGDGAAGWGLRYELDETLHVRQSLGFAASGEVTTADGRSFSFTLDYAMQYERIEHRQVRVAAGDARLADPLMVAVDGGAPRLGGGRMAIDLDGDGRDDAPAAPAPGTWILAYDRDRDNRIGDRSELFGPLTGRGFAELARLDGDGNGWIDEADAAWSLLRLWDGQDGLRRPEALGLGAFAVRAVGLSLTAVDAGGADAGQVRAGGVALAEDGRTLAMQQIDLRI